MGVVHKMFVRYDCPICKWKIERNEIKSLRKLKCPIENCKGILNKEVISQIKKKVLNLTKKKSIELLGPEEIKRQIEDWANDWGDTILRVKILSEIKEFSKKSGLSIPDLKGLINKILKSESDKNKLERKIEKDARKEIEKQEKEQEKIRQAEIKKEKTRQKIEREAKADAKVGECDLLKGESKKQECEDYTADSINWLEHEFYDSWDKVKARMHGALGNGTETELETIYKPEKWFFLSHAQDIIIGKPQLIDNVQRKIPLIRLSSQINEKNVMKNGDIHKDLIRKAKIFFFDESYDKRYHGAQVDCFSLDFWIYKIISKMGMEYYVLTQKKLPNETCTFKGMLVDIDDFAEVSRSMKIKSLARLFFLKEFEPDVKILPPEEIVNFTKSKKINSIKWIEILGLHKFGKVNRFPEDIELLRSAFILGGKVDGYPLHILVWGPTGTHKTMGYIETIAYKFDECPDIVEGADTRIKGLIPSFKEKPAKIGYLARVERIGFVDEIGKMLEIDLQKNHALTQTNLLGELNFLLEQKRRIVGSGNDNDCEVEATAKYLFVTNPIGNKQTIYDHVGLIDPTTMSRMFHWVQDKNEQEFVLGNEGVKAPYTLTSIPIEKNEENELGLGMCRGDLDRNEYLTLFDSCYAFISQISDNRVQKLVNITTQQAQEPMKTSVWKPRAKHHITLLIDGLCKHRCLFEDYDISFIANQTDYDRAERILIRMVKGWDTILTPQRYEGVGF